MQDYKLIKKVLDLYITDFCNLNCKHCYNETDEKYVVVVCKMKEYIRLRN